MLLSNSGTTFQILNMVPIENKKGKNEMKSNKMYEMSWSELKEAIDDGMGIILPMGATEQHGKHLPLCTDSFLAEQMALAVAERTNMLVAPTITYGTNSLPLSGGGQGFIGTTSIDAEIFINQVCVIVQEFIRHGFKHIVLYNWHGENASFVWEAAWLATDKGKNKDAKVTVFTHGFDVLLSDQTMKLVYKGDFPGWPREHAGILETSMILHLKPEYVDMSKASDEISEDYPWFETLPIQDKVITKCGSLWKESQSTAEIGKVICEEIVNSVIEAIKKDKSPKKE